MLIGLTAGIVGVALGLAAVQVLVSGGVQLTFWRGVATRHRCDRAFDRRARPPPGWQARARCLPRRSARGGGQSSSPRIPAWRRYYLDFVALALSGLIYWLTIRTGFAAVISPDSNPTLSLSVYMFFGPALLWIGATLLLVRLRGRFMSALARRAAGEPGSLASLVVSSLGRRSRRSTAAWL